MQLVPAELQPRGVEPRTSHAISSMRTIAIVNHKGGCGKTTTAVNLAGCLAAQGRRVLLVDADPQAHATLALGINPDAIDANLYDVLAEPIGSARLEDVVLPVRDGLDLAPSGIALGALEPRLAGERLERRSEHLAAALAGASARYDFTLIDCPPNLGILTLGALRAAREAIIPVEMSFFAIDGVQRLHEAVSLLCERIKHTVRMQILATIFDGRTRFCRETLAELRQLFHSQCFDTVIRSNVTLREAAKRRLPIAWYAPTANGASDYAALAAEVQAAHTVQRVDLRSESSNRLSETLDLSRFTDPPSASG